MAKRPSKKRKRQVKNQEQSRKFFMIVIGSTLALLFVLYLIYQGV